MTTSPRDWRAARKLGRRNELTTREDGERRERTRKAEVKERRVRG